MRGGWEEPESAEDRASTVYRWGNRLSGVAFSPGGDVSMVLYDKALQNRLSGKRHMEPLWAAAGWQLGVPVTRHEARLRRTALRELGLAGSGRGSGGAPRACLDDPWEFLTHVKDVFAAIVGRSEACPDAVDVAWIRRVMPDEGDANRSRWPTDPAWRVVQSATFAEAPAEVRRLIRRKQRGGEVAVLDKVQFGCLVSRVARLHPDGGTWTLSRALGEAASALQTLEAQKTQAGKDFGELVRERRRQRGLPLPVADKILPFCMHAHEVASHGHRRGHIHGELALAAAAEEISSDSTEIRRVGDDSRMAAAWAELEAAERRGASVAVLNELEVALAHEIASYSHLLRAQEKSL